jgi:hypothetical protein
MGLYSNPSRWRWYFLGSNGRYPVGAFVCVKWYTAVYFQELEVSTLQPSGWDGKTLSIASGTNLDKGYLNTTGRRP